MTDNYDAILRNASWDFEDMRSPNLVGNIFADTKGRFRDGERVHTSTVQLEIGGRLFKTRNTTYLVEFACEAAPIPATEPAAP